MPIPQKCLYVGQEIGLLQLEGHSAGRQMHVHVCLAQHSTFGQTFPREWMGQSGTQQEEEI